MVILSTAVRRRRQKLKSITFGIGKVVALAAVLVLTAYAAFETGAAKNEESLRRLRAELAAAEDQKLELIASKETAEERVRRMLGTLAELERDYRANVPDGVQSELLDVIRQRIAQGIEPTRLKFLLETATIERVCDRAVETQPLLVRTPLSTALENTVGFASDRVVLSAEGETLRLSNGENTAFFNPEENIDIRFLMISGEIERINAVLPLTHSVVLDSDEYQFQILPDSRRGYISITMRRCDYP